MCALDLQSFSIGESTNLPDVANVQGVTKADARVIYLNHMWSLGDQLNVWQAQGWEILTPVWPMKSETRQEVKATTPSEGKNKFDTSQIM